MLYVYKFPGLDNLSESSSVRNFFFSCITQPLLCCLPSLHKAPVCIRERSLHSCLHQHNSPHIFKPLDTDLRPYRQSAPLAEDEGADQHNGSFVRWNKRHVQLKPSCEPSLWTCAILGWGDRPIQSSVSSCQSKRIPSFSSLKVLTDNKLPLSICWCTLSSGCSQANFVSWRWVK